MAAADPSGRRNGTRTVAYGGLLGTLILLALTASAWSPTADLAFFSLTSLAVAIAVIETGQRGGWLVYGAAGLVSLAWPGLAFSWPFLLFFGPYPLLRAMIDKRLPPVTARLVRLVAGLFLAGAAASLFNLTAVLERMATIGRWIWLALPLGGLLAIGLYDVALSLLIQLYARRLHRS